MKIGGHIKWFNKDKGYGYIIGDDDETYFFTLLDCINDKEVFNKGDKVSFEPDFGEMDKAINVDKVSLYE